MPQVVNDHYPVPEYSFSYLQTGKALTYWYQVSPPTAIMNLLHGINLGFMGSVLKYLLAMQLIDAPVS